MTDNTIQGLRVYQWGAEGVKAQGTLTVDTQPTIGDTFTIGSKVFTFTAEVDADAEGEVGIGADLPAAKVNVVAAINGTDGFNQAHPLVTAAAFASDDCVITARLPGEAGDSIATTETFFTGTNVFDAATLGTTIAGSYARGTSVDATSKIAIENLEWDDADENIYRPQIANGLLMRNRGNATAVQHGTRFNFSDQPVVFEQLPHWLTMAIRGDPTVTWETSLTPDAYRWVFDRLPTTNPNPLSWTFEREFSNGAGDVIDQEAAYMLLSELTFSYAANEHLRMSGNGFGRKFATDTITASLTLPTFELGVSALSTVYFDDVWGNLGNTLLAEQVIGWELRIGTGFMPLATAEGRTTLDFTKHQVNGGEVQLGLRMTVLLDPTTYAAEAGYAAAGTRRAVRINVAGSGGRKVYFDALMQYAKPSLFKIGEQDGQDIVEIELEEATDGTNFMKATVEHPTLASIA